MKWTELQTRLFAAQVGACHCMTKTPEVKYHQLWCPFRLYAESIEAIDSLREKVDELEDYKFRYESCGK